MDRRDIADLSFGHMFHGQSLALDSGTDLSTQKIAQLALHTLERFETHFDPQTAEEKRFKLRLHSSDFKPVGPEWDFYGALNNHPIYLQIKSTLATIVQHGGTFQPQDIKLFDDIAECVEKAGGNFWPDQLTAGILKGFANNFIVMKEALQGKGMFASQDREPSGEATDPVHKQSPEVSSSIPNPQK